MDVLAVLVVIALVLIVVLAVCNGARKVLESLLEYALATAIIVTLIAGGYIWHSGHDNLAVVFVISVIVLCILGYRWASKHSYSRPRETSSDTFSSHWTDGKRAHYDKDGNVTGYSDKN